MNDLTHLGWPTAAKENNNNSIAPSAYSDPVPRLTPPPPLSGRSTPLSTQASGTSSTKPSNDAFANLVSFGSSKPANKLTLQERQKLLQEEKLRKEEERRQQLDTQFGVHNAGFWDSLAGKGAPAQTLDAPVPAQAPSSGGRQLLSDSISKPFAVLGSGSNGQSIQDANEDDLLAAFSAAAPVDSSSYFPPPSGANAVSVDDDDPFGLGSMGAQPAKVAQVRSKQNDDDILGLLGRPVSEAPPPKLRESSPKPVHDNLVPPKALSDPRDKLVADLVDMGFPANKAEQALAQTDTGLDMQAAIGWLLNEAHREAKQKSQASGTCEDRPRLGSSGRTTQSTGTGRSNGDDEERVRSKPAWMQQTGRSNTLQRKPANESPTRGGERDITQIASEVGNNLFKGANSLWTTGRKKVQRAVADFQQEGDPSQPKLMKEATREGRTSSSSCEDRGRGSNALEGGQISRVDRQRESNITDEALMLEARPPPPRLPSRRKDNSPGLHPSDLNPLGGRSPAVQHPSIESAGRQTLQNIPQRQQDSGPRGRLTRRVIEEESSKVYVSPARRKKANAQPQPGAAGSEPDLLVGGPSPSQPPAVVETASPPNQYSNPFRQPAAATSLKPSSSVPASRRPKAPPRSIPSTSPTSLSLSASHRQKGTEAYRRGDFSSAHSAYTAALSPLPATHPVSIVILCNRALVNLKVGDPRAAVSDADTALEVIGPSKGEGEIISLSNEGDKEMREFFGKALMRKAEGLEQMEKWGEASRVWRDAVEAGVGGSVSIQGRNRCEKAAGNGPRASSNTSARMQQLHKPRTPKPSSPLIHSAAAATSTEAVARLRAANAAAEKVDDEKFALADAVDAKIAAWKGGKEANIRALLASLDTVLWAGAGWKKVGLHELVLANKVKVIYMKGIAKVHPDKISTSATTEQRMISAAVFSTLNEAWDKFKKENGL